MSPLMFGFLKAEGMASDFAKALLGNVANSGSVFLATILLLRTFAQVEFATIGAALSYAFVVAKLLDAGISFTALRFSARNSSAGDELGYLGAMHLVILGLALSAAAFAVVPGLGISRVFGGEFDPELYLATLATAWAMACYAAVRSQLQAGCSYNRLLCFQLLTAGLRLLVVAAFSGGVLPQTVLPALLSLYFLPVVGASLLVWRELYNSSRLFIVKEEKISLLKIMFSYAPWVWVSGTMFVATLRIPIFFLEQSGDQAGVAVFTAALSFVSLIALANDAARAVIIPRTVGFTTCADFEGYFEKLRKPMRSAMLVLAPILLASGPLVALVLPVEYLPDSIFVFYSLAFSMLLTSILGTVTNLIHAIGMPQVEAIINIIRAIICMLGSFLVIYCFNGNIILLSIYCGCTVLTFEVILFIIVKKLILNKDCFR